MTEPGLIVALDFGGTKMATAVAGSDGEILDAATIPTQPAEGADRAIQRILDAATGLAGREQGIDQVAAVGVSTMGITRADRVLFAPNVPGWERLAIAVATQMSLRPVRASSTALSPVNKAINRVPPRLRLKALSRANKSSRK